MGGLQIPGGESLVRIFTGRMPGSKVPIYLVDSPPLFDREGNPCTDPNTFFASPKGSALLPLGGTLAGHKGFGLSLLVDKALRRLTSSANPCDAVQKAIEK